MKKTNVSSNEAKQMPVNTQDSGAIFAVEYKSCDSLRFDRKHLNLKNNCQSSPVISKKSDDRETMPHASPTLKFTERIEGEELFDLSNVFVTKKNVDVLDQKPFVKIQEIQKSTTLDYLQNLRTTTSNPAKNSHIISYKNNQMNRRKQIQLNIELKKKSSKNLKEQNQLDLEKNISKNLVEQNQLSINIKKISSTNLEEQTQLSINIKTISSENLEEPNSAFDQLRNLQINQIFRKSRSIHIKSQNIVEEKAITSKKIISRSSIDKDKIFQISDRPEIKVFDENNNSIIFCSNDENKSDLKTQQVSSENLFHFEQINHQKVPTVNFFICDSATEANHNFPLLQTKNDISFEVEKKSWKKVDISDFTNNNQSHYSTISSKNDGSTQKKKELFKISNKRRSSKQSQLQTNTVIKVFDNLPNCYEKYEHELRKLSPMIRNLIKEKEIDGSSTDCSPTNQNSNDFTKDLDCFNNLFTQYQNFDAKFAKPLNHEKPVFDSTTQINSLETDKNSSVCYSPTQITSLKTDKNSNSSFKKSDAQKIYNKKIKMSIFSYNQKKFERKDQNNNDQDNLAYECTFKKFGNRKRLITKSSSLILNRVSANNTCEKLVKMNTFDSEKDIEAKKNCLINNMNMRANEVIFRYGEGITERDSRKKIDE